jgi:hypothetical protein
MARADWMEAHRIRALIAYRRNGHVWHGSGQPRRTLCGSRRRPGGRRRTRSRAGPSDDSGPSEPPGEHHGRLAAVGGAGGTAPARVGLGFGCLRVEMRRGLRICPCELLTASAGG